MTPTSIHQKGEFRIVNPATGSPAQQAGKIKGHFGRNGFLVNPYFNEMAVKWAKLNFADLKTGDNFTSQQKSY